jgi:hypothetical protein
MLVALTRKKFEQLIPPASTGAQYVYVWGKVSDFLRRLLFSVLGIVLDWLILGFLDTGIQLFVGLIAGLYWLWSPAVVASLRNLQCRRYRYSGFWQGEVFDVYISEDLIGKEETVNKRGELVIIENRERRLNLEVGDESGFSTQVQVPLKREHQAVRPGDVAQLLVMSNQSDMGRITKVSDVYIPAHKLWVSDYPYLQRDVFEQMSRTLAQRRRSQAN